MKKIKKIGLMTLKKNRERIDQFTLALLATMSLSNSKFSKSKNPSTYDQSQPQN
jgi:hypothetical protein